MPTSHIFIFVAVFAFATVSWQSPVLAQLGQSELITPADLAQPSQLSNSANHYGQADLGGLRQSELITPGNPGQSKLIKMQSELIKPGFQQSSFSNQPQVQQQLQPQPQFQPQFQQQLQSQFQPQFQQQFQPSSYSYPNTSPTNQLGANSQFPQGQYMQQSQGQPQVSYPQAGYAPNSYPQLGGSVSQIDIVPQNFSPVPSSAFGFMGGGTNNMPMNMPMNSMPQSANSPFSFSANYPNPGSMDGIMNGGGMTSPFSSGAGFGQNNAFGGSMNSNPLDAIGKAIGAAAQLGLIPNNNGANRPNPLSGFGGGFRSQAFGTAPGGTVNRGTVVRRGDTFSVPGMGLTRTIGRSVNRAVNRNIDRAINHAVRRAIYRW